MRSRRAGSRSPDITYLTEIVRKIGHQPAIEIGLVQAAEDGGDHFDMDAEDLIVEVELVPSGRLMACRVMAPAGGPDQGAWAIPPVGAEVVVAIPSGDQGEGGVILGCLSTGVVPRGLTNGAVLIRASNGSLYLGEIAGAQPTFMAENFMTALDTLITAIQTAVAGITAVAPGASPIGAAAGLAIGTAKTTFDTAVGQNGKTTIAKVK